MLANNENADNSKMNFVHLRILFSWGKNIHWNFGQTSKATADKILIFPFLFIDWRFRYPKARVLDITDVRIKIKLLQGYRHLHIQRSFSRKGYATFWICLIILFASTLFIEVVHLLPSFILQKEGQNLEQQASL